MAQEINDLFHTSPIEDLVWEELKAAEIQAERQYEIVNAMPIMIWISQSSAATEPTLTSNAMVILTIRLKLRETVIGEEIPT